MVAGGHERPVRCDRNSAPRPCLSAFPRQLRATRPPAAPARRRAPPDRARPPSGASARRRWSDAALFVAVGDLRGLKNVPTRTLGNRQIAFQPGTRLIEAGPGIHVPIDLPKMGTATDQAFAFTLQLHGMSRLAFVPM